MSSPLPSEALQAITKTFIIAHDGDNDAALAQALVYNAGRLAWRMREAGLTTEYKTSVSDVVTAADTAAEEFVATALRTLRPDDGLLGEEGTAHPSLSGRTWVIDPVDGTYNFTTGSDYWCSALALVEGDPDAPDVLHFGAVHRPAMGYTWFGGADLATSIDNREVARLDSPERNVTPEQTCLAGYLHPTDIADPTVAAAYTAVVREFATVRWMGSASVDLGTVAQGNIGCWMQHSLPAWDLLPGRGLVEGAGGKVVQVTAAGKRWTIAGAPASVDRAAEILGAVD
jgi:fructose-1,6-bisphosphatase/inositol monophosphatase family enzyme